MYSGQKTDRSKLSARPVDNFLEGLKHQTNQRASVKAHVDHKNDMMRIKQIALQKASPRGSVDAALVNMRTPIKQGKSTRNADDKSHNLTLDLRDLNASQESFMDPNKMKDNALHYYTRNSSVIKTNNS